MNLTRRRNQEIGLLFAISILLFLGFSLARLAVYKMLPLKAFLPAIILVGLFIIAHLAARFLTPQADPIFIPAIFLLSSLGIIMIYRLKPALLGFQTLWLIVGVLALITVLYLFKDYNLLEQYKYISALFGVILLLSPIFFGKEVYGSKLWIAIGPFSFQPAEIAKILLVIFFAAYLKEKGELLAAFTHRSFGVPVPEAKHFGPLLTMWGISLLVLIFEKDLGSSLLFFGIFIGMLYIATQRGTYAGVGTLLFVLGAATCYIAFAHVKVRIDIWLNPWKDIATSGYQIVQSLFAIASGGLSGVGIGQGFPENIPAVHTDFIFSAISEELGLFGGTSVILTYLFFVCRGFKVALTCDDQFGKLLAAGLTLTFGLQAFVILGGVTKLIPLTGVTLPLMSYGGSSVLSNFILVALLMSISNKSSQKAGE